MLDCYRALSRLVVGFLLAMRLGHYFGIFWVVLGLNLDKLRVGYALAGVRFRAVLSWFGSKRCLVWRFQTIPCMSTDALNVVCN